MSKAYFVHKNFNWGTMLNILCFSVQNPSVLTKQQKVSRLYRAVMRQNMAKNIHSSSASMDYFLEQHYQVRQDFDGLLKLDENELEFETNIEKYMKHIEDTYDPSMFIDDSRPYSPTSGRYLIFDNDSLQYDPFGYYKPRLVSQSTPNQHMPYFLDHPQADSQWILQEQFDSNNQKGDQKNQ